MNSSALLLDQEQSCDEDDDDEDDDDVDDDDDEEEEPQKIKPWDVLMDITTYKMQDTFNEIAEKALHENPGKDLQEFVSRYKYLTDLSASLRKDPVNK